MLSKREMECLILAAEDKSVKETAKIMFISEISVKKCRQGILRKLECKTIAAAVYNVFYKNFDLSRSFNKAIS